MALIRCNLVWQFRETTGLRTRRNTATDVKSVSVANHRTGTILRSRASGLRGKKQTGKEIGCPKSPPESGLEGVKGE